MKLSDMGIILAACFGIIVLAFGWRQEAVNRALADQRNTLLRDSLQMVKVQVDSMQDAYTRMQDAYKQDTLRLAKERDRAWRGMVNAGRKADSLAGALAGAGTPAESVLVLQEIVVARTTEVGECRLALTVTDSLYTGCSTLLVRSERLVVEERELRVATERLADAYRKQARPSWLTKVWRGLPYLAAGVVIGAVITQ